MRGDCIACDALLCMQLLHNINFEQQLNCDLQFFCIISELDFLDWNIKLTLCPEAYDFTVNGGRLRCKRSWI